MSNVWNVSNVGNLPDVSNVWNGSIAWAAWNGWNVWNISNVSNVWNVRNVSTVLNDWNVWNISNFWRFCKSYGAALRKKVPTKFHAEFHEVCEAHRAQVGAQLHRQGPFAPSGPDRALIALPSWHRLVLLVDYAVGPRSRRDCAVFAI